MLSNLWHRDIEVNLLTRGTTVVLLIFVSGKIVLTGAKVREEIYQAFEMIYPVLQGPLNTILSSITSRRPALANAYGTDFRKI